MVRSGTDLRRVQLMLGHSSLNTITPYLPFVDWGANELNDRALF
jgi:hypothetical protein